MCNIVQPNHHYDLNFCVCDKLHAYHTSTHIGGTSNAPREAKAFDDHRGDLRLRLVTGEVPLAAISG